MTTFLFLVAASFLASNTSLYFTKSSTGIVFNGFVFSSLLSFVIASQKGIIDFVSFEVMSNILYGYAISVTTFANFKTLKRYFSRHSSKEVKVLKVQSIDNSHKKIENKTESKAVVFPKATFSEEDMADIKKIEGSIDLNNAITITNFGLDAQKTFTKLNDTFIEKIQHSMSIGLTSQLGSIMNKIQSFDGEDLTVIDDVVEEVSQLVEDVENDKDNIEAYVADLHKLFISSQDIVKQIDKLIEAGTQCLVKDKTQIEQLKESYAKTQDMVVFGDINEMQNNMARLEKKINSLRLTKMNIAHFSVQLKNVQNNERHFVDDIYNVIHNVIPSWKSRISFNINNQKHKNYNDINEGIKQSLKNVDNDYFGNDMLDMNTINEINKSLVTNIEDLIKKSVETHKNYNTSYENGF